jgi:hypothetical protein
MSDSPTPSTELVESQVGRRAQQSSRLADIGLFFSVVGFFGAETLCLLNNRGWAVSVAVSVLILLLFCLVGLLLSLIAIFRVPKAKFRSALGIMLGLFGTVGLPDVIWAFVIWKHR